MHQRQERCMAEVFYMDISALVCSCALTASPAKNASAAVMVVTRTCVSRCIR